MFEVDIICPLISFFLSTFVIWVYLHQLAFFFLSIFFVRRSMYRHVEPPPVCPGVSIVKPLMGLDARLRENLVSHFTIDYPKFEILFCVKDENDPVIDLVNSLRGEYPLVDSRLIIGKYLY
ncbi:unnamed protein product [Dicrocoelium dendriticum]|nr:unnamed protein product [Dicrocoelium dendriticum]